MAIVTKHQAQIDSRGYAVMYEPAQGISGMTHVKAIAVQRCLLMYKVMNQVSGKSVCNSRIEREKGKGQ